MTIRDLVPHPEPEPIVTFSELDLRGSLPENVIAYIQDADTVFLGASYAPDMDTQAPLHVETNIRGGRSGFVRVSPSDGRTIFLPDFSGTRRLHVYAFFFYTEVITILGNRLITSLGNNEAAGGTLSAALTILSFTTGDVLYVTGNARRLIDSEARAIMPQQDAVTSLEVTGAVLVRDALPIRERDGGMPSRSFYSPPVKFLMEELEASSSQLKAGAQVRLVRVRVHSIDLATFEWALPPEHEGVYIQPGQAAVLDLAPFSDAPEYAQVVPELPRALHDDRVRAFTVSSAHSSLTRSFELTIRHKQGGLMTGALFLIAQHQHQKRLATREDGCGEGREYGSFRAGLIGFTGAFVLPPPPSRRLLWVAGGVGITRFLAMLGALSQAGEAADVVLVLSTRDPEVLFPLVRAALGATPPPGLHLRLDVFTTRSVRAQELMKYSKETGMDAPGLRAQIYSGRITSAYWTTISHVEEREVFVCGPSAFEDAMVESLQSAGARVGIVHRELFEL
jgi:NAD(P)H-flavin reductase